MGLSPKSLKLQVGHGGTATSKRDWNASPTQEHSSLCDGPGWRSSERAKSTPLQLQG